MGIVPHRPDRREALKLAAAAVLAGPLARAREDATLAATGVVEGHPEGAKAGMDVLSAGGNAVDAAVAAALVTSVVSPYHCGPGGHGGSFIVATSDGKVDAIDFNTVAPVGATPDMFPLGPDGQVKDRANFYSWKAVGVPGTLLGLQRALDKFGTKKLGDVIGPAIRYARDGVRADALLVRGIQTAQKRLVVDP